MQVPFIEVSDADVNSGDSGPADDAIHKGNLYFYADDEIYPGKIKTAEYTGVYAKTGVGQLVKTLYKKDYCEYLTTVNMGTDKKPNWVIQYAYNFLYAVVTVSSVDDYPSIATMNGFTEITPGQIRAYMFSSPDGDSYLDLKNSKFKLGNDLMFEDGSLSLKGGLLAGLVGVRNLVTKTVKDANGNESTKIVSSTLEAGLSAVDSAKFGDKTYDLNDSEHGNLMMFAGANDVPKNSKFQVYEDGFIKANKALLTGGVREPFVFYSPDLFADTIETSIYNNIMCDWISGNVQLGGFSIP